MGGECLYHRTYLDPVNKLVKNKLRTDARRTRNTLTMGVTLVATFTKIECALNSGFSFSHIVGRMGKLESLDVKLFCAAGMDFYRTQVRWLTFLLQCKTGGSK